MAITRFIEVDVEDSASPGVRKFAKIPIGSLAEQGADAANLTGGIIGSGVLVRSLVATGLSGAGTSDQATATAIVAKVAIFGTVAANSGARLPAMVEGDERIVKNGGANALLLYPAVGGQIEGEAANAAISVPAGDSVRLFGGATKWQYIASAAA